MVEKLLVVCVAFLTLSVGRTSGTDCLNVTMFNFFCQLDGQCLGVNSTNTSLELICNGVDDCTFGSDEGGVLNSALMCKHSDHLASYSCQIVVHIIAALAIGCC